MRITVGICTWNRSETLRRTLGELASMRPPNQGEWEVVVVNNNSTDTTSDVVAAFAGRLPIREADEPVPGLSSARNRVIAEASGEYICWIDDDILVDRDWLVEYETAFNAWPTDGIFGGKIDAEFEGGNPPAWLVESLSVVGGVFGITQVFSGEITVDSIHLPLGGNWATRVAALRGRRFDPRLGRTAGNLLAGEETMFLRALLADGVTGHWVPGASVRHVITPRMQTLKHLRRYFHDWGASLAQLEQFDNQRTFFGRPLWMWRQAVQHEAMYRVGKLITTHPEHWVLSLKLASMAWGGLRQRPARVPRF